MPAAATGKIVPMNGQAVGKIGAGIFRDRVEKAVRTAPGTNVPGRRIVFEAGVEGIFSARDRVALRRFANLRCHFQKSMSP